MADSVADRQFQDAPIVSVAITAYNSAAWLPRSIESALAQRTDFPVEIVVGDDCSSDSTVAVARSYQQHHPGRIRVIERTANVGIQRNYFETFEQCRGRYIAWLDADDQWTDPQKLAIQVAALESDPTINACGHYVRWVNDASNVTRERYPGVAPGRYGLADILRSNLLPTLSVVFRNGIQRGLPAWYFEIAPMTDWPIWVLAALSGDILLLDRTMADYRVTPGSAMISKGQLYWYQTDSRFYEKVEDILPAKWHRLVRREKGRRYEAMAYLLRKQGALAESRRAAVKAFLAPYPLDNLVSKTRTVLASILREAQGKLRRTRTEIPS